MLEKRILINEDGNPVMEIKTNSHTVVRRGLTEDEQKAFDASLQKEPSAEVENKKEGAPTLPPVVSLPQTVKAVKTEDSKPAPKTGPKTPSKKAASIGAPVE